MRAGGRGEIELKIVNLTQSEHLVRTHVRTKRPLPCKVGLRTQEQEGRWSLPVKGSVRVRNAGGGVGTPDRGNLRPSPAHPDTLPPTVPTLPATGS